MNYRLISQLLGRVLALESALMAIPLLVCVIYNESILPFIYTILIGLILAYGLTRVKPLSDDLYAIEGFLVVALSWVAMSAIGALPFVFSREIPNFVDAFFEAVSGFTTTGSTILNDIEGMGKGTMFWRCFTNWIGGMGVLVFVMFVLPLSEEHSLHILRAEMPGPIIGKLVPKAQSTSKILYLMYSAMTLVIVVLLMLGGMNLYDALVHAFSTAGTGGFSNYANGVAHFDSAYIDYVIGIGLLFFGVNFNLYFLLLIGRVREVVRNEELLWYLGIVLTASIVISISVTSDYGTFGNAFRYAFFQVSSIITTAGHITADYDLWPTIAQTILFLLMFTGACAGGTNGGVKLSRLLIACKTLRNDIIRQIRPREVNTVKVNGEVVSKKTQHTTTVFIVLYVFIIIVGTLIVSLDNFAFDENFTAVLSCMGNIGPATGICGPTGNFAPFSNVSTFVLTLCMLIGRLEIFPMLILFMPASWKKKF